MKNLSFFLASVATQLSFWCLPAIGQVPPEVAENCKDARDFLGCVKAFTAASDGNVDDGLRDLRNAMKQVSSRLSSGTSLNDSSSIFQILLDKHAIIDEKNYASLAYQGATTSINLFNIMQSYWSTTINDGSRYETLKMYSPPTCKRMNTLIESFNSSVGKQVISARHKYGLLGCSLNSGSFGAAPAMSSYISGFLKDASVDPSVIQEYSKQLQEAERVAALGPWQRYLDKNPGMAEWAKANPALVDAKKEEYVKRHGSDPVQMPTIPASMVRFEGTRLESYIGK